MRICGQVVLYMRKKEGTCAHVPKCPTCPRWHSGCDDGRSGAAERGYFAGSQPDCDPCDAVGVGDTRSESFRANASRRPLAVCW